MKDIVRSIKGTRDFYPDNMAVRRWIVNAMRSSSERFGYQEYEAPCLESLELYAAKSGEELVKEQSFVFEDRGGDMIALRPELTPSLARMVATKQSELVFPLRWWSFGPFWRYERPQRGRSREFYQWNIDLIGSNTVAADAEMLAIAVDFYRRVGLDSDQVKIHFNDRRLMDASIAQLGVAKELKPVVFRLIDKLDKLSAESWKKYALEMGLTSEQIGSLNLLLSNADLWRQSVDLTELLKVCDWFGISDYLVFDPTVIRGLDYYTGLVFEGRDMRKKFRAIFGGGHYENLVADVGGDPLSGVGFAMGDVVIELLLAEYECIPQSLESAKSVLMTIFDEAHLEVSHRIATALRDQGINVLTYPGMDKLGKQFKFADKMGINIVLVIGPDEVKEDKVSVKNLSQRDQRVFDTNMVASELRKLLDLAN